MPALLLFIGLVSILLGGVARAAEWSGFASVEGRLFSEPAAAGQDAFHPSIVLQPTFQHAWENQTLVFEPFARWDPQDRQRTHLDLREMGWLAAWEKITLRIGIRRVFWGVTETVHLVDVVNQSDLVEDIDGEEKLGQPMIHLTWAHRMGTLDLFLLAGARARTFPGVSGRLRTTFPVATEQAEFERGRGHMDGAIRWSGVAGPWDVGLSHFWGTAREPRLLLGRDAAGLPVLVPFYDLIQQSGLDVQSTLGRWLWKLEATRRTGRPATEVAATGGLEYTLPHFYGGIDLGLILEYLWDDRRPVVPFDDDVAMGCRLVWNDAQGSEMLISMVLDRDTHARLLQIEASRRIGEMWKITLQGRAFSEIPAADPLFGFRKDDHLEMKLARYF